MALRSDFTDASAMVTDHAGQHNELTIAVNLKAPLASPALTGTPTAPTATPGTNTTQVATTAFVAAAGGGGGATSYVSQAKWGTD